MKEFIKKNFAIILAFLLPIALIIIVALSAYLPSYFLSTKYNFVYSSCTEGTNYYPSYYCNDYLQKRYSVIDGKIITNPIDPIIEDSDKDGVLDIKENYTARIFLHDTEKNESREITVEEAKLLSVNSLLISPDGVTISNNYNRGIKFFPFFNNSSSYGFYLTKGKSKTKLNLINRNDNYYYQNNFRFIGWTLPGRN